MAEIPQPPSQSMFSKVQIPFSSYLMSDNPMMNNALNMILFVVSIAMLLNWGWSLKPLFTKSGYKSQDVWFDAIFNTASTLTNILVIGMIFAAYKGKEITMFSKAMPLIATAALVSWGIAALWGMGRGITDGKPVLTSVLSMKEASYTYPKLFGGSSSDGYMHRQPMTQKK